MQPHAAFITSGASCCAVLGARKALVHCQSASRHLRRKSLLHYQAPPRCSGTVTDKKGAAAGMQKQVVTLSASLQSQSVSSGT